MTRIDNVPFSVIHLIRNWIKFCFVCKVSVHDVILDSFRMFR